MNKSVHLIILNRGQEEVLMRKMCLVAVFSIFFISAVLIVGASNLTESGSAVKRIDHILLTPEDPRGLYDFLTQELKLPTAWAFREYGGFASGGGLFRQCEPRSSGHESG